MGKNLYEKVFEKHAVKKLDSGQYQLFIGLHLIHEVTSPQAFAILEEEGLEVKFPNRTFATVDHIIPTLKAQRARPLMDSLAEEMLVALEKNTKKHGIEFLDPDKGNQGIVHVIGPEMGLTQPGQIIACGDSHTSTHGAFGSLAFGIGTSQVAEILATQTMRMDKLKVRRINVEGELKPGVYAKDIILAIINKLGVKGGVGYAYEYGGSAIESLNMEGRMTICNMSIEGGARVGYINPDEKTFRFLKGKKHAPSGKDWDLALEYWKSVRSDSDCGYDDVVTLNAEDIEPYVTWGITPGQSTTVNGNIPAPEQFSPSEAISVAEALEHMSFEPNTPIKGTKVDVVFIGSCTNSRISDLKTASKLVEGQKVAPNVQAIVVPGSQEIKIQAEKMGLNKIFQDAGFEWREAGCSMCLAMNPDKLVKNQICASTSNRNFKGRQGSAEGRTLLMSPAMAAAAAIKGEVSDPREVFSPEAFKEGEPNVIN